MRLTRYLLSKFVRTAITLSLGLAWLVVLADLPRTITSWEKSGAAAAIQLMSSRLAMTSEVIVAIACPLSVIYVLRRSFAQGSLISIMASPGGLRSLSTAIAIASLGATLLSVTATEWAHTQVVERRSDEQALVWAAGDRVFWAPSETTIYVCRSSGTDVVSRSETGGWVERSGGALGLTSEIPAALESTSARFPPSPRRWLTGTESLNATLAGVLRLGLTPALLVLSALLCLTIPRRHGWIAYASFVALLLGVSAWALLSIRLLWIDSTAGLGLTLTGAAGVLFATIYVARRVIRRGLRDS
ncbi:MAG: hypothetical protein AAF517_15945 [Planctomycetota bacterium]